MGITLEMDLDLSLIKHEQVAQRLPNMCAEAGEIREQADLSAGLSSCLRAS